MLNEQVEIPPIIGGHEVRTGEMADCRGPHDHQHILARYHKAGKLQTPIADREVIDRFVSLSTEEARIYEAVENYISTTYNQASAKDPFGSVSSSSGSGSKTGSNALIPGNPAGLSDTAGRSGIVCRHSHCPGDRF